MEVTKSVQKTISERYRSSFWVKAEMNKLNHYSHSGHCYPELVEKFEGKVIAQIKSNLWRDDYNNINRNFIRTLKEPLKDGIKILFLAKISFDPVYGISLQIIDIDPSFTLGDLEKEKQETIEKLNAEKIFSLNKTRKLPLLPKRIAIISVETSKGYADFLKVLEENSWNYKFFHYLFPSLLQGEKAIPGIITQLKRIEKVIHHFDVVAIIRGGGGDVGLSCYNDFELSKAIATFPIPIITGIGHATNETVSEMVSYQNAITPTKIAEFLIQKFHNFSVPVERAKDLIIDKSKRILSEEKTRVQSEAKLFRSVTETIILKNRNEVENAKKLISQHSQFMLKTNIGYVNYYNDQVFKSSIFKLKQNALILEQLKVNLQIQTTNTFKQDRLNINNLERNLLILDPINILKRGFSITLHNGKAVKDISEVSEGDLIETKVFNGKISSIVKNKNNG
ncbi:exodeoxyribonuclease VII large subunit [Flavobacterium caeni]|nr:exodeoxyribonuclease VII large subunit [Flavobacterium caeni]